MSPNVSIKLHALRFIAAVLVLLTHANQIAYTGPGQGILEPLGRMGVLLFFIMSGAVIAHVAERKHATISQYTVARLARLHSVLIPALFVTVLADAIGRRMDPQLYSGIPDIDWTTSGGSFPLMASFLSQSFGASIRWLSNSPLWSIPYEFWYYMAFGVMYYLHGARRWLFLALVSVVLGVKMLILFPVWLAGAVLMRQVPTLLRCPPALLSLIAAAGAAAMAWHALPSTFSEMRPLWSAGAQWVGVNFSSPFLWDYALLLPMLAVLSWCLHPLTPGLPSRWHGTVAWLANATFSLYCFHLPLIFLARASGLYDSSSVAQSAAATAVVFCACVTLSLFTERKKGFWTTLWSKALTIR